MALPSPAPRLLAVLLLTLASLPALAENLTGRVVGVHDGDTLTLLEPGNRQRKVRLNQIDAPELKQDFGQAAKQALAGLVFGQEVRIEVVDTDKYGRTVGTVWIGGTDANLEQVRRGYAWAYRKYLKNPAYLDAEASAKGSRLGLWSRPDAVPPWEFRHPERAGESASLPAPIARPAQRAATAGSGAGTCGSKRFCKEMRDCAEARYFLQTCGVKELDRDGDGMPCENLCK